MADVKNYMVGEDQNTVDQINSIAESTAYCDSRIRIMPDAHAGKGCVVGTTATFTNKICPNTVGVDIACRVSMFKLECSGDLNLRHFDKIVNTYVPAGFNIRTHEDFYSEVFPYEELCCWDKLANHNHLRKSIGTLGSGNHFISLDQDSNKDVWLTVHCGSRNLGKQICDYYQSLAIPSEDPKDLWYIEGEVLENYLNDMKLCNLWSMYNHLAIYDAISGPLGMAPSSVYLNSADYTWYSCIHNYVDVEHNIIRKGAISAQKNEIGIIPLNMRDGVLLVRGKGNKDWNCSLPHGAGRVLSRAQAKKNLSLNEYTKSMENIYTSSLGIATLDEAPMAYKNAAAIAEAITPNGEIVEHLFPIYNFKAH